VALDEFASGILSDAGWSGFLLDSDDTKRDQPYIGHCSARNTEAGEAIVTGTFRVIPTIPDTHIPHATPKRFLAGIDAAFAVECHYVALWRK
jgi:hypothetical protein